MKAILFCQNNYAFAILKPIGDILESQNHEFLWFITKKIENDFPYKTDNYTTSINDLKLFESDVIFVPGNEVPHYLRGLKTQVFHGLAGEKKGHFRIRHYFDLYLTQGPFFTNKFLELKKKHNNFDVIETGWPKLDEYAINKTLHDKEKQNLLEKYGCKKIILYAPTFSPKLTSAPHLISQIKELSKNPDYLIFFKFHPLMDETWTSEYEKLAKNTENIIYQTDKNIIKFLLMADILISDTSSVIYEFLLLDKPVITFNNISQFKNHWCDSTNYNELVNLVKTNLSNDPYAESRQSINNQFHPYQDGNSALRMVEATKKYIEVNGVPNKRNISFLRRLKIKSIFGKV